MIYEYQCSECGHLKEVHRSVEARNEPVYCARHGFRSSGQLRRMVRVMSATPGVVRDPAVPRKP